MNERETATEPFARLDFGRRERTGFGETVFGPGKTPGQLAEIFASFAEKGLPVLATRVTREQADAALVQSIRDMSDQIVQIHPQRQIIPAEMGSENHGAVYSGFSGGIPPFDRSGHVVVRPLQIVPGQPPADSSEFFLRFHKISPSCFSVRHTA